MRRTDQNGGRRISILLGSNEMLFPLVLLMKRQPFQVLDCINLVKIIAEHFFFVSFSGDLLTFVTLNACFRQPCFGKTIPDYK